MGGVLAVLKLQYAKTVALAQSIGDSLRAPAAMILAPAVLSLTPQEYHRWVMPSINATCKLIAMLLAWRVREAISAVQSGVKGGLIFSRGALALLLENGHINFSDEE